MLNCLLTHSNHVYSDPKQTAKMQAYPPLQTLLAAAVLRENGATVSLFDPALQEPRAGFAQALASVCPDLVIVCEDDFNFLSKMCLQRNRELAFHMAAQCREAGIAIAAHGSDASDHQAEYLDAGFDFILVGEVETTLLELVQGHPHENIAGLVYRTETGRQMNPRRPLHTDLDALPLPAWDLVDIDSYRAAWTQANGYFSLNIASSRGCPYSCNWCSRPIHGKSYLARSAREVAREMRYLKDHFAPDHLWFADDIFALSPRWAEEFAEAVEELDAHIPFKMQSRCDLMTRDTVKALRRAGCAEVWMGAESGSQKILDAMEKGTRVSQIQLARENLSRNGIRACFFLQFGYPGETWDDIEATLRMLRDTRPDDVGVSVSYPLPGTRFYQIVASQLGQKANWRDSADLAMMFHGTFSTDFYRALADAIHVEVRGGDPTSAWQHVHALKEASRLAEVA